MYATVGIDGTFLSADTTWHTVLGWASADLLGKPLLERVHPDDYHTVITALHHLLAGCEKTTFVCRYRRKEGTYLALSWYITLNLDQLLLALQVQPLPLTIT